MAAQQPLTSRFKNVAQTAQDQVLKTAVDEGKVALDSIGEQIGIAPQTPPEEEQPQGEPGFDEAAYRQQQERESQQKLAQVRQRLEQEIAQARGERSQGQQQYLQNQQEAMNSQERGGLSEEEFVQKQQEQFLPAAVKARQGSREQGKQKG